MISVTVLEVVARELLETYFRHVELSTQVAALRKQEEWLLDTIENVNAKISFNGHWRDPRFGTAYRDGADEVRHNLILRLNEIREEIKRVSVAGKQRDPKENMFSLSLAQFLVQYKKW